MTDVAKATNCVCDLWRACWNMTPNAMAILSVAKGRFRQKASLMFES